MYASDLYSLLQQKTKTTSTSDTDDTTSVDTTDSSGESTIEVGVVTSSVPINIGVEVPYGKGRDATVNGYNTVIINAEDGITLTQVGNVLTLSSPEIANKIDKSEKGVANGVATLDESGKVPESQLPDCGCSTLEVEFTNTKIVTIDYSSMKKTKPSITVVDDTGEVIIGDEKYKDNSIIEITFSAEYSGKVYLN